MGLMVEAAQRQVQAAEEDLNAAGRARRNAAWVCSTGFFAGVAGIPLSMCVSAAWSSLIVAGLVVACVVAVVHAMKVQDVESFRGSLVFALDKLYKAQQFEAEMSAHRRRLA